MRIVKAGARAALLKEVRRFHTSAVPLLQKMASELIAVAKAISSAGDIEPRWGQAQRELSDCVNAAIWTEYMNML